MEWDTRVWSFFIWLIATVLFLCGFATPYDMIGNRHSIRISFGGDVIPGGARFGLWGETPEGEPSLLTERILLSLTVGLALATLVGYILLMRRQNIIVQIIAFVAQIIGGLLAIIAIAVYRGSSDQLGEGFWMVGMAGALYVVNGIVLIFMPIMEYQVPSWKSTSDGGKKPKESVALLKIKQRNADSSA